MTRSNVMRCLCALALLLFPCSGFRLLEWNSAPAKRAPAHERHIQYRKDIRAGMSDRLTILSRLMWMGWKYNATIHFIGGESARQALIPKHSPVIHENWSHYVDIPGACGGRTPFHPLENFSNCVSITDPEEEFLHLFEHGESCVNIDRWLYSFHKLFYNVVPRTRANAHTNPPNVTDPHCDVQRAFSPGVKAAAEDFLRRYAVQEGFAAMHVRRCDRLWQNEECTTPEAVREKVRERPGTWIIFTYAEPGYAERLKRELWPLRSTHRILLEDEVVLNAVEPADNYFTYQMAMRLMSLAAVQVETQGCAYSKKVCG